MIHLLKIEWIKASRKATTWVMLALYTLIAPISLTIFRNFTLMADGQEVKATDVFNFSFENIWVITAFLCSYLVWFFVMIIVSISADDIRHNIWRQHVIEGLSRTKLVISKLIAIGIIALFATIVMGIISSFAMFQLGVSFETSGFASVAATAGKFFLYTAAFMVLALFLTQFLKSTGLTLILMLGWFWIAEPIIRWFDKSDITNYLIANSFNDLINNPLTERFEITDFQLSSTEAIIGTLVWFSLCIACSFIKMKQSDL